jgi:predicted O-methyltransferase YrrM
MKQFTQDYVTRNDILWKFHLEPFMGQPIEALEIGAHEGRSACWFLDNVLTHPCAELTTIDPWPLEVLLHNIRDYGHKVRFIRQYSFNFLSASAQVDACRYQFIYVDGSHVAKDVLTDLILCHRLLSIGGVMILDDYEWTERHESYLTPRPAIDAYLECFQDHIEILHMGYQVIVKRTA